MDNVLEQKGGQTWGDPPEPQGWGATSKTDGTRVPPLPAKLKLVTLEE